MELFVNPFSIQHGDTFICDFETLQSVARAAIAKVGAI